MRGALTSSFLALSLVLVATVTARADAVGPPPLSCPPGSTPSSSHSGPICFPSDACTTDSDCSTGATCMPVFQCVETRPCGGLTPPDSGPCTLSNVVGACGTGNTCDVGTCFTRHVCSSVPLMGTSSGCACAVGARSASASAALVVMAVLAMWVARRTR